MLAKLADTLKNKRLRIFFQDEARIGQKGRVCRRWFTKGQRPPGTADQRYTFAYIFLITHPRTQTAANA